MCHIFPCSSFCAAFILLFSDIQASPTSSVQTPCQYTARLVRINTDLYGWSPWLHGLLITHDTARFV